MRRNWQQEEQYFVYRHLQEGKKITTKDMDISRQIAHVRIHVERVIDRLKKFKILNTTISIAQVDLADNIMVSIAVIINLNASVVNK